MSPSFLPLRIWRRIIVVAKHALTIRRRMYRPCRFPALDIHDLDNLDIFPRRLQTPQPKLESQRDISCRKMRIVCRSKCIWPPRPYGAGDIPEPLGISRVRFGLPFPPDAVEVGVVEVEGGLGVGGVDVARLEISVPFLEISSKEDLHYPRP